MKFFENYFVEKYKSLSRIINTMNVRTLLEEKIVLFIASAKILEHDGSISPYSFYGQLPEY